jgi:hypothetical protein
LDLYHGDVAPPYGNEAPPQMEDLPIWR